LNNKQVNIDGVRKLPGHFGSMVEFLPQIFWGCSRWSPNTKKPNFKILKNLAAPKFKKYEKSEGGHSFLNGTS
jgi:hypothetical protein